MQDNFNSEDTGIGSNNPVLQSLLTKSEKRWKKMLFVVSTIIITFVFISYFVLLKNESDKNKILNTNPDTNTRQKAEEAVANPLTTLSGSYFSIREGSVEWSQRSYPVIGIYQKVAADTPATKINAFGKGGEYVREVILSKKRGLIFLNLEDKILQYDLAKGTLSTIYSGETIFDIAFSESEDKLAVSKNAPKSGDFSLVILDLNSNTSLTYDKSLYKLDNGKNYRYYLSPKFWVDDTSIYLGVSLVEAGPRPVIFNTATKTYTDSEIPFGKFAPDNLKVADFTKQAPYGGCYNQEEFTIYWFDIATSTKKTILTQYNTLFDIIAWNQSSDEFIYSAKRYEPSDNSQCPYGVFKEHEFFLFNTKTEQISRIDSVEEKLINWYPMQSAFFAEKNLDLVKQYGLDYEAVYLGSIN